MVIIKMWGGLGNQMFLYALYYSYKRKGFNVKIDLSYYDYFKIHNGYELPKIFEIEADYATKGECSKYANIKLDKFNRLIKHIYHKNSHFIQSKTKNMGYNETIFNLDNVYLEGYFQSERYFNDYKNEIKELYSFSLELNSNNKECLNKIKSTESISIHIRRGDYIKGNSKYAPLCLTDYYYNAIDLVKKKNINCIFYIFSNDIKWCKHHFIGNEYFFVDYNDSKNSFIDIFLMSQCKHNIIADSSFSWWGAWLNNNTDKQVIAPSSWLSQSGYEFTDIIPDKWILV